MASIQDVVQKIEQLLSWKIAHHKKSCNRNIEFYDAGAGCECNCFVLRDGDGSFLQRVAVQRRKIDGESCYEYGVVLVPLDFPTKMSPLGAFEYPAWDFEIRGDDKNISIILLGFPPLEDGDPVIDSDFDSLGSLLEQGEGVLKKLTWILEHLTVEPMED